LRLHMCKICLIFLEPRQQSNSLPLTEMLVNLNMMDE
jgi:hypothetical protein